MPANLDDDMTNCPSPAERNSGRPPKPAIITISCLFVTCPSCSHDIPANPQDGGSVDWTAAEISEFDKVTEPEDLLLCPECGQMVTISLPKYLPVKP